MAKTITLTGDVGFEITYQGLIETLESRGIAPDDDLVIKLFSPGGEVFEAEMIWSEIRRRQGHTTCYVDSLAASAASLIAVAADELIMGPNAYLMVHKPYTIMQGNTTRLRSRLKTLEQLEARYVEAYRSKTGNKLSEQFVRDLMSANEGEGSYITAAEAVEYGLADRVDDALAAAKIIPLHREAAYLKNPPPQIAAKLKRVLKPHEQDDLLKSNLEAVREQSLQAADIDIKEEIMADETTEEVTEEVIEEVKAEAADTPEVVEPEEELEVVAVEEPEIEAAADELEVKAEEADEISAGVAMDTTDTEKVTRHSDPAPAEITEPEPEIEESLTAKSEEEAPEAEEPVRDIVAELRARLEKPKPALKSVS